MKILINVPYLTLIGGVANHYLGLRKFWSEEVLYNQVGKKSSKPGSGKYRLLQDIVSFLVKIVKFNPDLVLLNPSLGRNAIYRDVLFLRIARIFRKKVIVFIHGFDVSYFQDGKASDLLISNLNRASAVIVLANEFEKKLREEGLRIPIYQQTTKVDDNLISAFDINSRKGRVQTLLFLARLTEQKGIFIALEAFSQLQRKYPYLKMRIVGDGPARIGAESFVADRKMENVVFTGGLAGRELISEYENADLYLLPTYHEGMPTSVLEAMAFGLPVITRPVGGLKDFFVNGKMGEIVDSLSAQDFVFAIEKYLNDEHLSHEVAVFNYDFAKSHFLASMVAKKMERIFTEIVTKH